MLSMKNTNLATLAKKWQFMKLPPPRHSASRQLTIVFTSKYEVIQFTIQQSTKLHKFQPDARALFLFVIISLLLKAQPPWPKLCTE